MEHACCNEASRRREVGARRAHRWRALSCADPEDEDDVARLVAAEFGGVARLVGVRGSARRSRPRRGTFARAASARSRKGWLHRGSKQRTRPFETDVATRATAEAHREAQALAADEFLAEMATRLCAEFGIRAATVKALAVSASFLRPAGDDDEVDVDAPKPKSGRGRGACGHRVAGVMV